MDDQKRDEEETPKLELLNQPRIHSGTLPDEREFGEDGIDLTLIRWMLSLTPTQRLEVLQSHINSIEELRRGMGN